MKFNRRARLDTSGIRDRRGMGGKGMAVGGGAGGIIILLIALFTGTDLSGMLGDTTGGGGGQAGGELENCRTGADVETNPDCRFVVVQNSIEDYWTETLEGYEPATFTAFSGQVSTGCG